RPTEPRPSSSRGSRPGDSRSRDPRPGCGESPRSELLPPPAPTPPAAGWRSGSAARNYGTEQPRHPSAAASPTTNEAGVPDRASDRPRRAPPDAESGSTAEEPSVEDA